MKEHFVLASLAACVFCTMVPRAQGGLPTAYDATHVQHKVVIPKLKSPDAIDTDLSRGPWTRAALLTGNLDWRRIRTADVPIWTYLFYDNEALWVACRNEMAPGPELKYNVKQRDGAVRKDDNLEFWLDVGRTERVYYKFFTNPAGVLYDAFIIDKSFDSNTVVETTIDERGWTAVMRIPFVDLGRAEPLVGTTWAFNAATRMGTDNSWAPVLGGYHTPEQFATLVFGGSQTEAVRMRRFKPLLIGPNTVELKVPLQTRYVLEAIDDDNRLVWRDDGVLGKDERLDFELPTDQVHHVNFIFTDVEGNELLTFWRPVDSPAFLHRLPELKAKAADIQASLERLPGESRAKVEAVLKDMERFFDQPISSMHQQWDTLARTVIDLERRVGDARLFGQTLHTLSPQAGFALALASPMQKVMIRDFPCRGFVADHYDLALARNEHEAVQVVVIPYLDDLRNVSVSVSAPRGSPDNPSFTGNVTVSLVGHVETRPAASYLPDYVGWYPDPLLDFQQSCDAAVGEHVAFWIDVATRKDTRAGDYQTTVTVTADGCKPIKVTLNIHVWDITLPDGTHLGNAFTYAESSAKRLYRGRWSSQLAYKYYDFILDHRLNIDGLYGKHERDIEMLTHGARRGMNAFNVFYVGKGATVEAIRKLLEERMPPLKKAGLDHLAYLYGFDEVNDDVFPKMKEIFGMARALYPELPRMTTGYDTTYGKDTGLRDYVDIWVPLIPRYNMVEAEKLRAEGKDMWWYLCVGPRHPFPNWFVESPAIEARLLMGAMSYKYQAGGVLYFMTNQWRHNDHPITSGPYTDWHPGAGRTRDKVYANGDGSIFCAGPDGPVTTIRYENIRDGLEDYEYLYKLSDVVKAVRRQPATVERVAFMERACGLLAVPDQVVESSSRYTYDPQELYAFRAKLAYAIIEGERHVRRQKQ